MTPSPSFLSTVKRWTGLDRAITFTIMARFWSALAGMVTVLLIVRFLTPHEQGYYYTFFSLVSLQVVFELGFSFVVLQLAAHEKARVAIRSDGRIEGDPAAHSRLASIFRSTLRWYSSAAVLMLVTLLPAGIYFFGRHQTPGTHTYWMMPWCLLVSVAVLTFLMDPFFAFFEGCGFVPEIARMRLLQAVLGSVFAWSALFMHRGLYAPAMLILGNACVQIFYLGTPLFRRLTVDLYHRDASGPAVRWKEEIWPFQWRIAMTWLASYFTVQFINPVLFAYCGPIAAGRMGMSLSIATSIGSVGLAWMSTKAAPFGTLVAQSEIVALDQIFFRTLWQSTGFLLVASAALLVCLVTGSLDFLNLTNRFLPPWIFVLLLLTTLMNHIVQSEALYMRSHKREPLLVPSFILALVIIVTTIVFARTWGVNGVVIGYFVFGGVCSLLWANQVFHVKRREWHGF